MKVAYEGMGCTAVLDTNAGIVVLNHQGGVTVPKHKKVSSPWVIPLGAIEDVEFQEKSMMARGWVRFVLIDRVGWSKTQLEDVNSFFAGKEKVTPFVDVINAARSGAVRTSMVAQPAESRLQRLEAKSAAAEAIADVARASRGPEFQGIGIRNREIIEFKGQQFPLVGARAYVEIGSTQRRTTATRIVLGSVVTLGVGTVVGAMAKKKTNNVYVTIELADGQVIVVEADAKKEGEAREFTAALTSAAAVAARNAELTVLAAQEMTAPATPAATSSPLPPPSVPAGWYRDPENTQVQRYWDGGQWTGHTAPLAPQ